MSQDIEAIYTDGACSGNPGPGGWGVVIQFTNGAQHELGGHSPQTTNNRMELQASIEALKALKTLPITTAAAALHTDSEYVKNGITKWLPSWKKRGWKTAQGRPVLNQDLWEALDVLNSPQIEWHYVRAHVGHPGNERADAIARAFSLRQPLSLRQLNHATDSPISSLPAMPKQTPPASAPSAGQPLSMRVQHLRDVLEILEIADAIATQGYLITPAELADLVDSTPDEMTRQGEQWIWRNWSISQAQGKNGQSGLWQLHRVHN